MKKLPTWNFSAPWLDCAFWHKTNVIYPLYTRQWKKENWWVQVNYVLLKYDPWDKLKRTQNQYGTVDHSDQLSTLIFLFLVFLSALWCRGGHSFCSSGGKDFCNWRDGKTWRYYWEPSKDHQMNSNCEHGCSFRGKSGRESCCQFWHPAVHITGIPISHEDMREYFALTLLKRGNMTEFLE